MTRLTRRSWLKAASVAAMGWAWRPSSASAAPKTSGPPEPDDVRANVHPEFPSHDPAEVRKLVAAAHTDLETVRGMVARRPELSKVAWDWGFGDWETALGAASHMGRRDIAEVLLTHGARPDLFTFAMLGSLDVVRAAVSADAGLVRLPGPHGITLLRHAESGGDAAKPVADFLRSVGGAEAGATSLDVTAEERKRYLGRYVFGPGPEDAFEVLENRGGRLAIRRGARFGRVLHRVERPHGFAPGGAPSVRVRFHTTEGRIEALSVDDPEPIVVARRVD